MRNLWRLAAIVVFAFAMQMFLNWLMRWTDALPAGTGLALRVAILGALLAAYALLIAIPFVPGAEIGISLVLMRGAEVAPFVYLATVAGLMLAFWVGCRLPLAWLRRVFSDLHLNKAARLLERIEPLSGKRRLALLRRTLPARLGGLAVDYRYVLLALLINLPGSGLIGGGGGIALLAGLTGLFNRRLTMITVALAVLPVPLIAWIWGPGMLS